MSAPPAPPPPQAPSAPVAPAAPTEPASPSQPAPTSATSGAGTDPDTPPSLQWPLPKDFTNISSGFGQRTDPMDRSKQTGHYGIDLSATEGTDIYAAADGQVAEACDMSGYGKAVYLNHGVIWATRYGHCSELIAKKGSSVRAGEVIAKVGKTGLATGPHLHFEVRENGKARDPEAYLRKPQ